MTVSVTHLQQIKVPANAFCGLSASLQPAESVGGSIPGALPQARLARAVGPKRQGARCSSLATSGAAVVALALGAAGLQAQQPLVTAAAMPAPHTRMIVQPAAAPEPPSPQAASNANAAGKDNNAALRDDLFAGTEKFAKGASQATEVNMDPESLDLVGGPDSSKAHRMLLNVVHTYTYDKPGMYNVAEVEEFRRKLEGGEWHCSLHSRDLKSGQTTDICSKRRAPDMVERAIITVAPTQLTFIHTIRKANGQGGSLGLDGLDTLGIIPGVPLGLFMPEVGAEMQAQILAATAGLRAEMPLLPGARPFSIQTPRHLQFKPSPEQKRQLEKLQRELKTPELPAPTNP